MHAPQVFLNGETAGVYYDLVFGGGPDSLCNHAPMVECYAKL